MVRGEHFYVEQTDVDLAPQASSGFLSQETIDAHEDNWVNRENLTVYTVCGDDREMEDFSTEEFETKRVEFESREDRFLNPAVAGLAIYGQMAGQVKNTLVAGTTKYGESFSAKVGGFNGLANLLMRRMASYQGPFAVLPAMHSAKLNEMHAYEPYLGSADDDFTKALESNPDDTLPRSDLARGFCPIGDDLTGCAYATNVRTASELVAQDEGLTDIAMKDLEVVFDDTFNEMLAETVISAHDTVARQYPERSGRFTREMYVKLGAPVMLLKGDHQEVRESGLLVNLNPQEVGKTGTGFYRADLAAAALTMRLMLPEYDLPVKPFMMAVLADAVPVREVLASHDGLHAQDLGVGMRGGSVAQALEEIERLENAS
jgi:hypothetical protein